MITTMPESPNRPAVEEDLAAQLLQIQRVLWTRRRVRACLPMTGRQVTSFVSATKLSPTWTVEIFRLAPRREIPLEEPPDE